MAFYPFFFSSHISDSNLGPCVAIVTNSPRTQTSGSWTSSHCESGSEGFLTSPVYGSGAGSAVFMWAATRAGRDGVGVCVCVSARVCGCVCACVCVIPPPPGTYWGITEKAALKNANRWREDGHLNGYNLSGKQFHINSSLIYR